MTRPRVSFAGAFGRVARAPGLVVGIAGLQVIEDGDALRVFGPPAAGTRGPARPDDRVGNALDGSR